METTEQGILTVKWLGLSGVELRAGGCSLLVDPVYTRLRPAKTALTGVKTDEQAVRERMPANCHILISHAHHDHLMDTPCLAKLTGAPVYCSPNSCTIASACGAPKDCLHVIGPGSRIKAGPFTVTALPATHIRLPGYGDGKLPGRLRPPLRMFQYRMDGSMVFLVEVRSLRLLVGPGLCLAETGPVDGLAFSPVYCGPARAREYVGKLKPRFLLPIHWEQLFAREGRPLRGSLAPGFPPRRYKLNQAEALAKEAGASYLEPVVDREYDLTKWMG